MILNLKKLLHRKKSRIQRFQITIPHVKNAQLVNKINKNVKNIKRVKTYKIVIKSNKLVIIINKMIT